MRGAGKGADRKAATSKKQYNEGAVSFKDVLRLSPVYS